MCPNTEYFLVRISPHSDCISPCSVRMQGNARKYSVFGHFSHFTHFRYFKKLKTLNLISAQQNFLILMYPQVVGKEQALCFCGKKNIAMLTIQMMN